MALKLNVALLLAIAGMAVADLPVHCLKHDVHGDWDFHLSPPSDKRSSCGHKHPDTEEGQPMRDVMTLVAGGKAGSTQRVSLQSPNVAQTKDSQHGTWTMVYDEGFEVNVDGQIFFAFSNFTFQTDPKTDMKQNVSHCGETMVGWYRNTARTEFGCYYGVKANSPVVVAKPALTPSAPKPVQADTVALNHSAMANKVAKINKKLSMLQLGWKARTMPKWVGKTMGEINSYAGLARNTPMRDVRKNLVSQRGASPRPRSFLQAKRAPAKLPASFDWSNVSGTDWLEPVMDQGSCGSCYAASSMRMLSVRHKITLNDPDAIPFSINAPLHCGEYNQGCKGGYGSLISKWGEDVGLVPATCMRYNTEGTCKLECDLDKLEGKRYRVANHRLIGGWYGNSSTHEMMEEIHNNGPIVVSFEPADDFMFYSEGIYKSSHAKSPPSLVAQDAKWRVDEPWQKVDHAVLAVGWGEEDGQKYWLVQNSWGEDWGEDGFFRIARDENDSGVESIPEAADVVEDEQNGRRVAEFFAQLNTPTKA